MSKKTRPKPALDGVAAVDRALSVLTAFREGDEAVPLAELAERTGLVKSTIMRLAVSLEAHGFLAHQPDGSYRLGAEVLRLGSIYQQSFRLEAHVMPVLEALVAATGESASFYIRHGDHRQCLFRVDSPQPLRLHVQQGDLLPMDRSAIAQVLRTFGAVPPPPHAATMDLPLYTAGANDPHTAGMAVPVFGPGDAFAGALSLTGPITRLTREAAAAATGTLREAAEDLTRALGGRSPRLAGAAGPSAPRLSGGATPGVDAQSEVGRRRRRSA
jgi:DNA-binding IclR family transcriptional regulator